MDCARKKFISGEELLLLADRFEERAIKIFNSIDNDHIAR
jgi:hypothetical protein